MTDAARMPRHPEAPDADRAAGWARREAAAKRHDLAGFYAFAAGHAAFRLGRSRATPQFDEGTEPELHRRWLEGFALARKRAMHGSPGERAAALAVRRQSLRAPSTYAARVAEALDQAESGAMAGEAGSEAFLQEDNDE